MAIPVSEEIKQALQAPVKQLRSTITWTGTDMAEHTITSEDRIVSIKKEAEGYYLASALRKITIITTGTDMDLLDQAVKVNIQVKLQDQSWGTIPWGTFQIAEAKASENKESVTFTGYGGVNRLQEREYIGGELTFPTTVSGLISEFAEATGLELGTAPDDLPNADAPIPEDLWANITGTTYRDILEELAGATGTLAVIGGGDDTLDLNPMPIAAPTDTMTDANLINFKIGPNWGPSDAVVLSRQPQGDNVELADQAYIDTQAGYNWIQYSDTFRAGSVAAGITATVQDDGTLQVVCNQNNGNWHTGWWDALNGNSNGGAGTCLGRWLSDIQPGDQFTISFTIKKLPGATGMPKIYINNSLSYQAMTGTIGTEYSEIYNTRTWAGTNIPIHIGWQDCTGTFIIKNWQLKKGSYAPYEPYKTNGRTDIVIANNEIVDDQRETAIIPLLAATEGLQYRDATYKTEGHGYHEIGDRIDVTIGGQTFPTIITKSVITVDGGINETLTSTTPEAIAIDYAKAGGITKTIFNTELAVDKQHQEIEAIVSRQDQTDETITENYTRLLQTINNIQATVQVSGGGNLIKNSVGFGKQSDGTLTIWQYGAGASTTTVKSQSSTASLNAGAISGHEINITGATSTTISQDVQLTPGELYNLSFRIQKGAVGSATISITDGITTQTITAQDQVAYTWNQLDADFTPANGSVTITITANNCTAAITDLMLAQGGRTGWRQASGEIYNLQVSVDQDGVQVKSATYAGDYTAITPLEFAGYSNASGIMKKVFTINRDVTEVEKLYAKSQIKMPPMEIVPIDNANYKGWAFVQTTN